MAVAAARHHILKAIGLPISAAAADLSPEWGSRAAPHPGEPRPLDCVLPAVVYDRARSTHDRKIGPGSACREPRLGVSASAGGAVLPGEPCRAGRVEVEPLIHGFVGCHQDSPRPAVAYMARIDAPTDCIARSSSVRAFACRSAYRYAASAMSRDSRSTVVASSAAYRFSWAAPACAM